MNLLSILIIGATNGIFLTCRRSCGSLGPTPPDWGCPPACRREGSFPRRTWRQPGRTGPGWPTRTQPCNHQTWDWTFAKNPKGCWPTTAYIRWQMQIYYHNATRTKWNVNTPRQGFCFSRTWQFFSTDTSVSPVHLRVPRVRCLHKGRQTLKWIAQTFHTHYPHGYNDAKRYHKTKLTRS